MTTSAPPTLQQLPIQTLKPAPWNPRGPDLGDLDELTTSIRAHGVLVPLIVRPLAGNGTYEVLCGHRRLASAKAANLQEVPVIVRPLDDGTALEVALIDNLLRADIHPLAEAAGYKALMLHAKYTVDQIAERLGRSVKYVYDRVKLLQLVPPAKTLFLEGRITAGHAILLARLKAEDQRRVVGDPGDEYQDGGLFTHEALLWSPDSVAYDEALTNLKPVSVRELQAWIDQHVRFDAAAADPLLFPETVGTLQAAQEQAERVVAITHESRVDPDAKAPGTRTIGPNSWKRADGATKDAKPCDHAVTGVVVIGPGRGEAFKVCLDKKRCKVHWATERTAQRETAKGARSSADARKREQERDRQAAAARELRRTRWRQATPAILEALAEKVKKAPARATGLCAELVLQNITGFDNRGSCRARAAKLVPPGKTAEDLVRHAAFLVLVREAEREWVAFESFPKRAKAFGLDVTKILDQVAPVQTPAAATPATKGKRG